MQAMEYRYYFYSARDGQGAKQKTAYNSDKLQSGLASSGT
jgi:hypothetical protein